MQAPHIQGLMRWEYGDVRNHALLEQSVTVSRDKRRGHRHDLTAPLRLQRGRPCVDAVWMKPKMTAVL